MAITRRDVFKAGLVAAGASLTSPAFGDGGGSGSTLVSSSGLQSPFVDPWVQPLYQPPILVGKTLQIADPTNHDVFDAVDPVNGSIPVVDPDTKAPCVFEVNELKGDHGLAAADTHQRCDDFPPKKFYQLDVRNTNWSFHPSPHLQPASLFTYQDAFDPSATGAIPGPMIHARYGEPIVIRINNKLVAAKSGGIGMPDTATHLHNMHTASESDGYPEDFVSLPTGGPSYRDQHYAMTRAGYDQYRAIDPVKYPNGDPRESLGTLWYHDHRVDFTSQNVYRGLFGFFNAFDEVDTGDEKDTSASALRLPSGEFDIMMSFLDPQFDAAGNIFFNVFDTEGHLGDKIAVNGKIQPYLNVQARKYRFRLLDTGPSRFYQFFLSNGLPTPGQTHWEAMTLISNDGNLLAAPLATDSVTLAVAERMDVVIDFSKYGAGDKLYLVNRMQQTSGRGPDFKLMDPGVPVLQFIVQPLIEPDSSQVPSLLRPVPVPTAAELTNAVHRSWEFNRSNGAWTVNGLFFDPTVVRATVTQGSTEIWTIKNGGGGWSHPIHIHFEEFQILSRNGAPPPLSERGRKDVMLLHPDEEIKVFFRFRDFTGHYVMHCHNVVHEDHAMMIRFDIVPAAK
jgi:FtsP/CotA-like multicopper oxidase with cupredoxin domain